MSEHAKPAGASWWRWWVRNAEGVAAACAAVVAVLWLMAVVASWVAWHAWDGVLVLRSFDVVFDRGGSCGAGPRSGRR